jgi:hypothetical protein
MARTQHELGPLQPASIFNTFRMRVTTACSRLGALLLTLNVALMLMTSLSSGSAFLSRLAMDALHSLSEFSRTE